MKKPMIVTAAALVAVALTAGSVAVAQSGSPSAASSGAASPVTAHAAGLERAGTFSLAESENLTAIDDTRVIADAPDAAIEVPVTLDVTTIEQYWLWASGVEVTAHGLTPNASVEIGIVFASGDTKRWAPVTADADGTVVARVRTLDVDPENTRPDVGLAQITVTSSAGEAGSALLTVTATGQQISVSTDPTTITQDAFLDAPITVHANGFPPLTKVFFNLGLPDTTMFAVGEYEGLHSDENGEFTYELQMNSVNSQVGTWLLSFQSENSDRMGSGTFQVTAGAERIADKTVTPATPEITAAAFSTDPGMRFSLEGFLPFDTYEMILTTSRGYASSLGISRTNGEGRHSNAITSPKQIPEGLYTITARSTTTGDYAVGTFTVTGNPALPASEITLSTNAITAGGLSDPAGGVTVQGRDITPGTSFRISLRNAAFERQPLLVGADAYATAGDDGLLAVPLVTLEPLPAGTYTVWVDAGGGVTGYNLLLPLQVTADATAETAPESSTAPSTAPSVAPRLAPVLPSPALPNTVAPNPSTFTPEPAPTASSTPAPDPFEDDVPMPAQPVPSVPTH